MPLARRRPPLNRFGAEVATPWPDICRKVGEPQNSAPPARGRSALAPAGIIVEPDRPVLRPYQLAAVDDLRAVDGRGFCGPIFRLAAGGGKTVVFAEIVRAAAKRNRVVVLVHCRELVRHTSVKQTWAGVPHGTIAASFAPRPDESVQTAAVRTIVRRLDEPHRFDLIIIDERCHGHAATCRAIFAAFPAAKLLSATPARLDGKGHGCDAGGPFDSIVCSPSIRKLTKAGYLAPCRVFVPRSRLDLSGVRTRAGDYPAADLAERVDRAQIAGHAVAEYRRHANHQLAIAFCVSIRHAEHVAAAFGVAGYRTATEHGGLDVGERDRLIAGRGSGAIEVLTSCDLISEGLDVPAVGALTLLRPTRSLVLFIQQIGRSMRPSDGNCLVHGLPDQERRWTLDGAEKPAGQAPVRVCAFWARPTCWARSSASSATRSLSAMLAIGL